MQRYYDELAVLCEQLLSLMAQGLGMSADTFASSIDRHTSALRLLHYPHVEPSSVASGQLRAGAHSDYGTLTLLRQDDAPGGLEVRGADDEWHQYLLRRVRTSSTLEMRSNDGRRVVGAPPFIGCRFLHPVAVLMNGSRLCFS